MDRMMNHETPRYNMIITCYNTTQTTRFGEILGHNINLVTNPILKTPIVMSRPGRHGKWHLHFFIPGGIVIPKLGSCLRSLMHLPNAKKKRPTVIDEDDQVDSGHGDGYLDFLKTIYCINFNLRRSKGSPSSMRFFHVFSRCRCVWVRWEVPLKSTWTKGLQLEPIIPEAFP